jgi:nitrogen-specific signal transduction histidine kinase
MGLGLNVAADIVARHDGRIEVESQPERTAFNIFLPIETDDTP